MAPEGDGLVQVREEIPPLRIRVLGDFRVERNGEIISDAAWQRPKAKMLIKLLVVAPGHRLHRDQVEDLLWPDLDGDSAHASFRKVLSWARHALEPSLRPRDPSSYLHLAEDILFLDPERIWIDADGFKRLATHALTRGSHEGYMEALALYGGELLPEDRYEDWTARERVVLADLNVQLLTALARLLEAQGQHGAGDRAAAAGPEPGPGTRRGAPRIDASLRPVGTPASGVTAVSVLSGGCWPTWHRISRC